jgi:trehalose synthase
MTGDSPPPKPLPAPLREVAIPALAVERFDAVLADREVRALSRGFQRATTAMAGRTVWCVNSTSTGGGVAQMLHTSLGYALGAGVDARWAVIHGEERFFRITKRLHHMLHGAPGDGLGLRASDREAYSAALDDNAAALARVVAPGDVVILHDPQTAGLAPPLRQLGARLIWRCHVGVDHPNELARAAWGFLRPYLNGIDAYVFSIAAFIWSGIPVDRVFLIPPAIDAASTKNLVLTPTAGAAILHAAGLLESDGPAVASFFRSDRSRAEVRSKADVLQQRPLRPSEPYVLHISRWDRLKDPVGVMEAFATEIAPVTDHHLILAGAAPDAVSDDPEGAEVLEEVHAAWHAVSPAIRGRIHVASLPTDDPDANAAMVNALQRRAEVVLKKSRAEGFGLGLTEAMWKSRPVVATAVGGVREQVIHNVTGLLVADPGDLRAFGRTVVGLLGDAQRARGLGAAAHRRVRDRFLEPRHLRAWADLLVDVVEPNGSKGRKRRPVHSDSASCIPPRRGHWTQAGPAAGHTSTRR